jgi:hypothetical protein
MHDDTLYLVTDIETDGPDPGPHSMLSFGCVVTDGEAVRGEFSINLATLPGATGHARTLQWWQTQPEAWAAATTNPVPPEAAIAAFVDWVRALPGKPVFAAAPVAFDGCWIEWYLRRFAGLKLFTPPYEKHGLFQGGALDIGSLAMGVLGLSHAAVADKPYPPEWLGGHTHTHCALDDARGYASLLRELLRRRPAPFSPGAETRR